MALKFSTILIFLTGALLIGSAYTAEQHNAAPQLSESTVGAPPTIDGEYYYCRWGRLHVPQNRAFCVVEDSIPNFANYELSGDREGDYTGDFEKIVSDVKALTNSELRSARVPDLLLILSAHPQDEMNRMSELLSKYRSLVFSWGCPNAAFFKPRLGEKAAVLIDLTNLIHYPAVRCMEAAIFPYFGVSIAEQFPISEWSWHVHEEPPGSNCDRLPDRSLPFAIIPLVDKDKQLLFGRVPLVEKQKFCFRWGGTTF